MTDCLIPFPNWTCSNPILISVHSSLKNWFLPYSLQPLSFQWWQFQLLVDPQTHICIPHTLFLQTFMPLDWHMPRIFLSPLALLLGAGLSHYFFSYSLSSSLLLSFPGFAPLVAALLHLTARRLSQVTTPLYPAPAMMLHFICTTLRASELWVHRIRLCSSSELSFSCWAPRRSNLNSSCSLVGFLCKSICEFLVSIESLLKCYLFIEADPASI